jgi:rhamnulokinase
MGIESPEPVLTEQCAAQGFTNEGGVLNTIRLLKNISGLWIVQECKRVWAEQGEDLHFDTLDRIAEEAKPFVAVINPDDASFASPGDMPERIRDFCRKSGQQEPETKGEILRVALESLALRYRWVLERLEELKGGRIDVLHIVGGGTKNKFLNQLAADAVNRKVVTGPVEATAAGNVLMQMIAAGELSSLAEGRALVAASFPTETYEPKNPSAWDQAYAQFCRQVE